MNIEDFFNKDDVTNDDFELQLNFSAMCPECSWPMDVYFSKSKKLLKYICDNDHEVIESID